MKHQPLDRKEMSDKDYTIALLESINKKVDVLRDDMNRQNENFREDTKEMQKDITSLRSRVNWMYAITTGVFGVVMGVLAFMEKIGIKMGIIN